MPELNAQHYLEVYRSRKEMQDQGISNPPAEIKVLTQQIIKALSKLPPDEKIIISNGKFLDSQGKFIARLADSL